MIETEPLFKFVSQELVYLKNVNSGLKPETYVYKSLPKQTASAFNTYAAGG